MAFLTCDIHGWVSVEKALPSLDPLFAEYGISETVELWDCRSNIWIGHYNYKEKTWWNDGPDDGEKLSEFYKVTHWRVIVGPYKR